MAEVTGLNRAGLTRAGRGCAGRGLAGLRLAGLGRAGPVSGRWGAQAETAGLLGAVALAEPRRTRLARLGAGGDAGLLGRSPMLRTRRKLAGLLRAGGRQTRQSLARLRRTAGMQTGQSLASLQRTAEIRLRRLRAGLSDAARLAGYGVRKTGLRGRSWPVHGTGQAAEPARLSWVGRAEATGRRSAYRGRSGRLRESAGLVRSQLTRGG